MLHVSLREVKTTAYTSDAVYHLTLISFRQQVDVTLLWPSPVGFPQKLQGLSDNNEVPFDNMVLFNTRNTKQTARRHVCSLASAHSHPNLQLCCPFIWAASAADWLPISQSTVSCWQPASSLGQIGDSCHSGVFTISENRLVGIIRLWLLSSVTSLGQIWASPVELTALV